MHKPTLNKHLFKHNDLISMALGLMILGLMVSWAVELLAIQLFRLG